MFGVLKLQDYQLEHLVHFMADYYIRNKQWAAAISWLKGLDSRESRAKIAKCYMQSGYYEEACKMYETVVQEYKEALAFAEEYPSY